LPITAFEKAAALLSQRAHFRAELKRKLLAREFEATEVDEALDRVASLGYLDEIQLASAEAERLRTRRGLGRNAIAADLARRGAPSHAIELALGTKDLESEFESARAVANRWLRGQGRGVAALARHLDRKGYDRHVIFRVLKELPSASGDGVEPESDPAESVAPDPLEP
jgi:regulatory protein